jgi:hypothetical protein
MLVEKNRFNHKKIHVHFKIEIKFQFPLIIEHRKQKKSFDDRKRWDKSDSDNTHLGSFWELATQNLLRVYSPNVEIDDKVFLKNWLALASTFLLHSEYIS